MTLKEFKEKLEKIHWALYVHEDEFDYVIRDGLTVFGIIGKNKMLDINCNLPLFEGLGENLTLELFDLLCEFAKTPIDEREDEKRYIIPLHRLLSSDGEQQYLTHQGSFFASRRDKELRQTWKEEHLKYIPEEYRKYAVEVEE